MTVPNDNLNEVEVSPEVASEQPNKPKQYLVMADELHVALLGKLIPGLLFVHVEGMNLENRPDYMMLVNPIKVSDIVSCGEENQCEQSKMQCS